MFQKFGKKKSAISKFIFAHSGFPLQKQEKQISLRLSFSVVNIFVVNKNKSDEYPKHYLLLRIIS